MWEGSKQFSKTDTIYRQYLNNFVADCCYCHASTIWHYMKATEQDWEILSWFMFSFVIFITCFYPMIISRKWNLRDALWALHSQILKNYRDKASIWQILKHQTLLFSETLTFSQFQIKVSLYNRRDLKDYTNIALNHGFTSHCDHRLSHYIFW